MSQSSAFRHIPQTPASYRPVGVVTPSSPGKEHASGREWRFTGAEGLEVAVTPRSPETVQISFTRAGERPAPSWAVIADAWDAAAVIEREHTGGMALDLGAMSVEIGYNPLRLAFRWPDGVAFGEDDHARGMGAVEAPAPGVAPSASAPTGSLRCYKRLEPGERIIGAGERTEPMDKRGYRVTFWNTDPPGPHHEKTGAMYASIPFWLTVRPDGRVWGLFVDSVAHSDLDAGATDPYLLSFGVAEGDLTYHVFAGPTPADVLRQYSALTGRMPLPPRWALGYGQSRWSYFPEAQVRDIAAQFRTHKIPCDHLWLDIDYMDGYRVFTWSPTRFPDPQRMLADLREQGYKVVTIIDPGVKADPTDPTFDEGVRRDYFVRRDDGTLYTGVVWPGESAFADFSRADVRTWWGDLHRPLLEAGVAGIWDDMNEPALTDRLVPGAGTPHGPTMAGDALHRPDGPDGPRLPHSRFHNAYGMQMARATREGLERLRPNERPFLLTRSGYAGIQRYAAIWTGDNHSRWEHLRLAARMCLNLGMSGTPLVGFDAGGFWDTPSGEMLVRFTQLGALFPFFRNHCAMNMPAQEPWILGEPYTSFARDAIELRYRLLPYLYTLVEESVRTGAPITRPLVYSWPEDPTVAALEDQMMVGGDLLAAPVFAEEQRQRDVRFPAGAWRDWLTGQRYDGPLTARVECPIDVLPLYLREGAIVPLGPVMQYVGELTEEPLTLVCSLGLDAASRAEGALYEDDGATRDFERGAWRRTRFVAERGGATGERITVRALAPEGAYTPPTRPVTLELRLPHADLSPRAARSHGASVSVDGVALAEASGVEIVHRRYETLVRAHLGTVSAPFSAEVTLHESAR